MVRNERHGISYCTSTADPGVVTLSVYRVLDDGRKPTARGDHDGRKFATVEDAQRFAFEHGYLSRHTRRGIGRCAVCGDAHGSFAYLPDGDSHFYRGPEGFNFSR